VRGDLYSEPSKFVTTTTTTVYHDEDIDPGEQLVPTNSTPSAAEGRTPSLAPTPT
jgi:hypothetical protein